MSWHADAACRDMDPAIFYPERGANATLARRTCARCPVAPQCAQEGESEYFGVWGGTTPVDRGKARSRGQRLRLLDVLACTECDARVWAPKQTATTGFRCDQCRADEQAIAS